jgi:hypothetical protein
MADHNGGGVRAIASASFWVNVWRGDDGGTEKEPIICYTYDWCILEAQMLSTLPFEKKLLYRLHVTLKKGSIA